MDERDAYMADAAELRERAKKFPAAPPDIDAWVSKERARVDSLNEADLLAEWQEANDEWFEREQKKRRLELLRDRFGGYRGTLLGAAMTSENKARQALPAVLSEAIARMKSEVQERTSWGKTENPIYVSNGRGQLRIKSNRTEAHDRAQHRAEHALHQLESLILVPGDLTSKVKAILSELHNADMAELDEIAAATQPAPPASDIGQVIAEIEPERAPRRGERLYPAA